VAAALIHKRWSEQGNNRAKINRHVPPTIVRVSVGAGFLRNRKRTVAIAMALR